MTQINHKANAKPKPKSKNIASKNKNTPTDTIDIIDNIDDATIIKHNHLIEARYHLPLMEQRILLFLIAKFNFKPNITEQPEQNTNHTYLDNLKIHISASELLKCFDLSNQGNNFNSMHKACDNLMSFKLDISNTQEILMINVFSSIRYKRGSGSITAVFSHEIMPYLYALKSHFTKYKLTHVAKFKSDYSIRIYELLKMHEFQAVNNQFFKMISMLEFKKILGIENKYAKFSNFEMDVLKRSQDEINDKSDLSVNYEKIKQGKIIHSIKFMCESKPDINMNENLMFTQIEQSTHPLALHGNKKNKPTAKKHSILKKTAVVKLAENTENDIPTKTNTKISTKVDNKKEQLQLMLLEDIYIDNDNDNSNIKNLIHACEKASIRPALYNKWLKNYSVDTVYKNFMYTLQQFKANKINNIAAYMYKALEHNYAQEEHANGSAQVQTVQTHSNIEYAATQAILNEQEQKQTQNKQLKKISEYTLAIFNALDKSIQNNVLNMVFDEYPELKAYYEKNKFGGHMPYFVNIALQRLNLYEEDKSQN